MSLLKHSVCEGLTFSILVYIIRRLNSGRNVTISPECLSFLSVKNITIKTNSMEHSPS
jgi:hypothetical protein